MLSCVTPHETIGLKIHKNKSSIQNKVDDKTDSVDIANAFADQYRILYSSVPSESTYLSELQMRAIFVYIIITVCNIIIL